MRTCNLNGLPGLLWEYARAPHARIAVLHVVSASRKLGGVTFATA